LGVASCGFFPSLKFAFEPNSPMKKLLYFILTALAFWTCSTKTPSTPGADKIEALIKQMTIEEKVGQLNVVVGDLFVTGPSMNTTESPKFDQQIRSGEITGIFNVHGAAYTARLQKIAVEESRLKIPLLFGADVIHGFQTVTPEPIAEAASWDLAAIEASARVAAEECSAVGINWTFAPMVDISRDPRWGRVSEGAGEDPYLGSRIAEARVHGFQGDNLADPHTIAACVKHFAAYGAPLAGRDYSEVDMSERQLREVYLPPYEAAIKAGAASLMNSFNLFNGVPANGNKFLLQQILRKEWGFQGMVVSDYSSIGEMLPHGYVADSASAAKASLEAGCDMDMMSFVYLKKLPAMVKSGAIKEELVNEAVRRVLKLKYDLGLFDDPYRYSSVDREKSEVRNEKQLATALDIAHKSIVLLKNENNRLPLAKDIKRLAVIGPLADNKPDMNGSWSFFARVTDPVTILEGIRQKVGNSASIKFAPGCDLYNDSKDQFAAAKSLAAQSDVVIMVVGESAVMNGEGASRSKIGLPGVQEDLVKAIHETGKPIIVVLVNARPLAIEWIDQHVPAIVESWTLGSTAGTAVADVLFGDFNPSGKLPATFPRNEGQIPIFYAVRNGARTYQGDYSEPLSNRIYQSKYRDVVNSPLYPFGYGLSYTQFEYSNPTLDKNSITGAENITVSVQVKNTGKRDGDEVVQLYIRDWVGSSVRPVKELKGFRKISLAAGESKEVTFTLTPQDLSFYREDMSWGVEPGKFSVFVGGNSNDVKEATFELR